jgi:tRNA(Ile)-lysidine synthetase-like protein
MLIKVFMSLADQNLDSSKISLAKGRYVLAVSGGVDSMVLASLLLEKPELELIVAHIDHGIRDNSPSDRTFVELFAREKGLEFYYKEAGLGPAASEELARDVRYEFLYELKRKHKASAVITAHHQDDVIETAILNMIRGTGRSGLSSLKDQNSINRPMLGYSKKQIIEYAERRKIAWVEDETNFQLSYLRNYVRHKLVPVFDENARSSMLGFISKAHNLNYEIDVALRTVLKYLEFSKQSINRHHFIRLSHPVSKEVLRAWLKNSGVKDLNSKNIEDLTILAKTLRSGKSYDIDSNFSLQINKDSVELIRKSR